MGTLRFLGTSDAQGVPRMLCNCNICIGSDNVRKRPSAFIDSTQKILIDVSPDFRQQFLEYQIHIPDLLLVTHAHNDHIAGFGDLADLCFWNNKSLLVISPMDVIKTLKDRYPYLHNRTQIQFIGTTTWKTDEYEISFHKVNHGHNGYSYGIKFTRLGFVWAYISDAINMSDEQMTPFFNLDLIIMGASYWDESTRPNQEKRSVYDVQEAIKLKNHLNAHQMILTHMSHDIDITSRQLPSNVEFSFDGKLIDT
ncbi:phosphoribosyl 1,2-cyclic phosphate phosphodiesterase [Seinonella peptonophila]|uniref:Phosphoribosyl 1,2-cyclic phosphate phosphodiesterase n=1 Tax=Seinonella peptonophila TaxID=112248 RepID=A0A1M4ZWH7_9BACL|nr:MBL fold metallo-hydrolase [Seinonella peptonophila]SHF22383.1 phosphoribosyl 1,2-cyclic phosphate phosphodiesterase [Seinonella peptonophila]